MRDDPGDSHVQGEGDIDQRLAVLEDCHDEFVRQVTVRAAVASRLHIRRKRRALCLGKFLFQSLLAAIERSALTPHPSALAFIAGRIPTDSHTRCAPFAGAEQCDFGAEGILVTIV
jgi:hypothetical protein